MENPYVNARREWNERYGSDIAQKRAWQIISIALTAALFVETSGVVYMAMQSKVIPYIVQVDSHGYAMAVKPAEASSFKDERIVRAHISEWIVKAMSITTDWVVQKQWLKQVYQCVTPGLSETLNSYYKTNNPMERGGKNGERISVTVLSVLPLSEKSWQVDWDQQRYDNSGRTDKRRYKGVLEIQFVDQTEKDKIIANPTGIYFNAFHWQQLI